MSDVKINGNTYNGITEIKVMKSDDSGYVSYKEGQTDDGLKWADVTIGFNGEIPEDIDDPDAANPNIGMLQSTKFGTIKLTGATQMKGGCPYSTFDNLLLPNVAKAENFPNQGTRGNMDVRRTFTCIKCTGMLDLGSLATGVNWGQSMFQYAEIGTLKLGAIKLQANAFATATISNLIWDCSENASIINSILNAATRIENLYVPAAYVNQIAADIDAGTITKVGSVRSMTEWSDSNG